MQYFSVKDLRPGDVLLYDGQSVISKAIMRLDGSPVCHASLYMGNGRVAESLGVGDPEGGTPSGLNINKLDDSIRQSNQIIVRRLPSVAELNPVLACAHTHVDSNVVYAQGQIGLLALICFSRKIDRGDWLTRKLAKTVFKAAAAVLRSTADDSAEKMICSEFVFRAYDEADCRLDDAYTIAVLSQQLMAFSAGLSQMRSAPRVTNSVINTAFHPDSIAASLDDQPEALAGRSFSYDGGEKVDAASTAIDELNKVASEYVEGPQLASSQDGKVLPMSCGSEIDYETVEQSAAKYASAVGIRNRSLACGTNGNGMGFGAASSVIADFVTPGDLLNSKSLKTVGRLIGGLASPAVSHRGTDPGSNQGPDTPVFS